MDSNTLTIENTAPTITSVSISPSAPQVDDTLTCSVSGFSDDDGDSDQSTYSWTLDGTEVSVDSSVSGGTFLTGDQVTCTVTPYDGTDTGTAVSDSVTVANTPPELDSVTLSPSTVYEGDTLTCTPGTATDVDGDSVSYSYDWKVNSSTLSSHDSELSSDYWGRNDDVACIVTPSDGTDDGDAVSSNTVTVSNTAPELDSITLSPDPAFEGDSLDCDPDSATDVDGDSISYLYSWTVDGLAVSSTSSSLTSSFFAKSDEVYCTASPTDGTDTGVAVDSNTVTIENTAPSISSVSIDLSNPTVSETLVCSYSGYSDADGDSDQSTYEWTIDGSTVGTSESLSGVFDSGDTVTCTVTPYDGTDTGSTMSAQVNIGNTIPVLDTVSLTPTTAYEGDTLTCTPSSLDDDDGDSITYGYQWTVNSWDPGVSDNELNSSHWSRDNEVFCTVTPYDGSEYGAPVSSNTVTISNTVPEITSVTVSPSSPTTNESLTASVSTHDEDGDSVSVSYVWLVDGSPASGAFGNTLSGETYFDKHQEIAVEVTPSDNEGAGTSATSDSVTAVNSAPGPPQVNINPNSAEPGVDELVCRVDLDSEDDDDDSISYSFSWQVEDQDYPDEFSSAAGPTTTTFTDDTVPAEDTTLGDHWSCIVVPNDGEDDGEAGTGVAQVLNLVNVGNDVVFSGTDFLGQDELRGGSLNVSQNGTLHRLAMLTPETSGNVKMALYTDSSGGPDTLVIGTESTALNGGTLEIEVGAAPINAGSYWLLAVYDQSTTVYDDPGSTSPTVFQGMPFSQSFKSNFGPYTSNAGQEFNYYLVMEEE